MHAKVTASTQHAIANSGLYVLGYVAIRKISNRLPPMKDANHTTEALAWRFCHLFCIQDPSQSQRLKHEQRRRRYRDVDHNREQQNGDIDGAVRHSFATACPFAERAECIQNRTGGDQADQSNTYDHVEHRLDDETLPSRYGNCAHKASRVCQRQIIIGF